MHSIQLTLFQKAKALPSRSVHVAALRGEQYFIRIIIGALALCVAAYLYFVGLSIMNLISNREAVTESTRLQSDVAMLEQEYFTLSKNVSAVEANAHGLSQPIATTFVRRADAGGMATAIRSNDL